MPDTHTDVDNVNTSSSLSSAHRHIKETSVRVQDANTDFEAAKNSICKRSKRLAADLRKAHSDMVSYKATPAEAVEIEESARIFMRTFLSSTNERQQSFKAAPAATPPNHASPQTLPNQSHQQMPNHSRQQILPIRPNGQHHLVQNVPMQVLACRHPVPAQNFVMPIQSQYKLVTPLMQQTPQRRRSNNDLLAEVDALKHLVQNLVAFSPDVNLYARQLIQHSSVLSQLDWLNVNAFQAQRAFEHRMNIQQQQLIIQQQSRRIDGGCEGLGPRRQQQRRESEMSSNSNNSTPNNKKKKETASPRKKGRNDSSSNKLKSELDIMRAYINKIVSHYLGPDQKLHPELKFEGGFSDLESHAQRLVAAGYGRIVEDEIRVNRKNNRQAFITMSNDREGLERDGIVLLPVARRYAFDSDTVRAFVLKACSPVAPNTDVVGITGGKPSISLADEEELSDDSESQTSDVDNTTGILTDQCPKAFVISIVRQTELRQIIGTISFTNPTKLRDDQLFYKLRPYDLRVPMVYIAKSSCQVHIDNHKGEVCGLLFLAHILETDHNGHCIGELLQPVGRVGNLEAEIKAILLNNGLRDVVPFEQRFNDMFAQPAEPFSADQLKQRMDLRKKCIFTIDPLTARDLDDALSIEKIGSNKYEVGVHISDVSHYLQEDTELDNIVKERSTSIYLVNEVIHMLPQPLCFRCSLLPGEDKFTFSVFWIINGQGKLLEKPRFTRTVINSCTQFAYEHAQKIIDNPFEQFTEDDFPTIVNGFEVTDVVQRVLWLHGIASNLRKQRFDNGSLTINNPKLRFSLDPLTGEPISYEVEVQREANRMIEEFMLLANQSVARFIYDAFPNIAILRRHEPPLMKSMKALREKLQALGLDLDISSSKTLQESFKRLCSAAEDPAAVNACLSQLLMKPMARAKYFCSSKESSEADLWHYALSIPIYTHFTSPIRRYPDIMVHRLAAAALNYCPPPSRCPDELHVLTKIANDRKYNAKLAGDDSSNLYFKRYVAAHRVVYMPAVVMEIFQSMMNVVTMASGHVIRVTFSMQKVLIDTHNAPNFVLMSERNSKQKPVKLHLFSQVAIRLIIWDNKLTGFLLMQDPKRTNISNNEKYLTAPKQNNDGQQPCSSSSNGYNKHNGKEKGQQSNNNDNKKKNSTANSNKNRNKNKKSRQAQQRNITLRRDTA